MSERYMVATALQGKLVDFYWCSNWTSKSLVMFSIWISATMDGTKSVEELYRCLGIESDYGDRREVIEEVITWPDELIVVDLDDRNIYFDIKCAMPYTPTLYQCWSPVSPKHLLNLMTSQDTCYASGSDCCSKHRLSFDSFNRELLLEYCEKRFGWRLNDQESSKEEIKMTGPEAKTGTEQEALFDLDEEAGQEISNGPKPAWLIRWEEKQKVIISEIGAKRDINRFGIYELFLMGIAFETLGETLWFADALNEELATSVERKIDETIDLSCIFEFCRDITKQERNAWLDKHGNAIEVWTADQKYKLKAQLYHWRERIPGIIRNELMDGLGEAAWEVVSTSLHRLKLTGLFSVGEFEAADLSKFDSLREEDAEEIRKSISCWHERRSKAAKPEYSETETAPLDSLLIEEFVMEDETIDSLDLSVRAYNILRRANIYSLDDLAGKTLEDLKSLKNMGKKALDEICRKAKEIGIEF